VISSDDPRDSSDDWRGGYDAWKTTDRLRDVPNAQPADLSPCPVCGGHKRGPVGLICHTARERDAARMAAHNATIADVMRRATK
jgi:hypothetical protein